MAQPNSFQYDDRPYGAEFGGIPHQHYGHANQEDTDPSRLATILEEALPSPDESPSSLTLEEQQKRRELADQAWDQVRRWLWSNEQLEIRRAAVSFISPSHRNSTPLHLLFQLHDPPVAIVTDFVEAAPDVLMQPDALGRLPLHYACEYGVTTEVLELITELRPAAKYQTDNFDNTPLLYACRSLENPNSMASNISILSDQISAKITDKQKMLPLHWACYSGAPVVVIQTLVDWHPDGLFETEDNGKTPLRLAIDNAQHENSPQNIEFLIQAGPEAMEIRDKEDNLPFHGFRSIGPDDTEQNENVEKCLGLYLDAGPKATSGFLSSLKTLPESLQDVAVVSPHVQKLLNDRIVQRFPTSMLLLDFYVLVTLIVCFEVTTEAYITEKAPRSDDAGASSSTSSPTESDWDEITPPHIALYCGVTYFLLREVIQVASLRKFGSLTSWAYDTTNLLDVTLIITVFYYTIYMTPALEAEIPADTEQRFRAGVAFTKGVLWMAVIYFLKSTLVDFAVFLSGVFYVVQRLVAFLLAVSVILLAFAEMFYIAYQGRPVCQELDVPDDGRDCEFPHCTFQSSLLKVYTMMMGEIGSESRYANVPVAQILYVCYAFLVVILLSNVLIAIVTDSYEIIQNDRASIVFWSNRLDFVAEMDGISSFVREGLCRMKGRGQADPQDEKRKGLYNKNEPKFGSSQWSRELWESMTSLFRVSDVYEDEELGVGNVLFWVRVCVRVIYLFIMAIWVILGVATAGILWPPQIREWLFVQKKTALSRAELERQKLEQLREIQNRMQQLETEIKKEMANDRDEIGRLKAEVEAVQTEVLLDLQQVKDLMTTLLDLGANALG